VKSHGHEHDTNVKRVDRLSSTKVRLVVELSGQTLRNHEQSAAQRYSAHAKIPGFRPGKAPIQLIQERFKDEIRRDVVSHLLEAALGEAVEKTKLFPVNQPQIHFSDISFEGEKPFEFQAEFEIQPEIELRNYKGIPLRAPALTVTEEEVEKTLHNLSERLAVLEPADSKVVEKGQFAVAEVGYELTTIPEHKEVPTAVTAEVGMGKLLPELDAALLGMEVGSRKTANVRFPEDYEDRKLAGKEALFNLHLLEIKKKKLPEVDDALANQIKEGSTVASLKQEIRDSILAAKKEDLNSTHRKEIVDYLLQHHSFDAPSSMIERQAAFLVHWIDEDRKKRGMPAGPLSSEESSAVRKKAEHMVKSSLILKEVAVKEKISLDEQRVEEKVQAIAKQIGRDVEETRKILSGKEGLQKIRDEVLTDQVFEFLIRNGEMVPAAP